MEFLRLHSMQGGSGAALRMPKIRLQLSKLPELGVVVISGKKARLGDTFLQSDIDRYAQEKYNY